MANSEKERLAAEVADRWADFQHALSNKRRYPVEQFRAFWDAGKRYAELTRNDPLIHRNVVVAINGLREFLSVERSGFPVRLSRTLTGWRLCCSADTIPISRAMNRQGCKRVGGADSGSLGSFHKRHLTGAYRKVRNFEQPGAERFEQTLVSTLATQI